LRLPEYEVSVHIRYNEFGKKLEKDLLMATSTYVLDASTEYQGVKDFHWTFESWQEAVRAGENLKEFVNNPNLLLLLVKANNNETIKPIYHKDRRKSKI